MSIWKVPEHLDEDEKKDFRKALLKFWVTVVVFIIVGFYYLYKNNFGLNQFITIVAAFCSAGIIATILWGRKKPE
ncbi:MAG: hypothetical protein ABJH98_18050 [Reichenbachiella sp.]|uniref:hypothetical protein n=1 Tax=Reichenbachiella sp. TaxID=2184521 RepID=UPI003298823E